MPAEVTASGATGSVAIEIVVNEQGRVSAARIVRSVPLLDALALSAVRQWRFAPATLQGRPVPVRMIVVVNIGA
jgi:TonB family protein